MNWTAKLKNKVHRETELVKEITKMASWCPCKKTIAKTIGCSYSHVKLVTKMHRSTAHVFLKPESYNAISRREL